MQLVLFIGVQASGKSTFYRQRFAESHLRLSLDMLRTRFREAILFDACLEAKQPMVIDNTNPSRQERARYILPAKAAGFEIIVTAATLHLFELDRRGRIHQFHQSSEFLSVEPRPSLALA